jgi:protein-tyrosine phosphatase
MTVDRHLPWDNCYNIRDLGGVRRVAGGETRWGAMVRADSPERLTPAGWAAAWDYGIRTVIDLRNEGEIQPDSRPSEFTTVSVPLDGEQDKEFWDIWGVTGNLLTCTPLYYTPFLDRKPERVAAAVTAIARAQPGGVMFHCAAGRDRTGLISLVLLALAGAEPEEIAADYMMSTQRLEQAWMDLGLGDQTAGIEKLVASHGTTAREALLKTLGNLDVEPYLLAADVHPDDIAVIRHRLG